MSELRQRKVTNPLESFKELDAFKMNKLPEEIEQKSTIGKTFNKIQNSKYVFITIIGFL